MFRTINPRWGPGPQTRPHDPDFDTPARLSPILVQPDFASCQRLVANPFLALLLMIPWVVGFRDAFLRRDPLILLALLLGLVGIACLLQYHCRDCGKTGLLFSWRSHACGHALARQFSQKRRRLRGPNPTTQTVLWMYLLAIVTFLAIVAGI